MLLGAALHTESAEAVWRPVSQPPECVTGQSGSSTCGTTTTTTLPCVPPFCGNGSTTTTFQGATTTIGGGTSTTLTLPCTTTTTLSEPSRLDTSASGFGSAVAIGKTLAVIGSPDFRGGVNTARFIADQTPHFFTYTEIKSAFLPQPPRFSTCAADKGPQFGFALDIWADDYLVVGVPLEYSECDFSYSTCATFDRWCCKQYGEVWAYEWREAEQDWGAFDEPVERVTPPPLERFTGLRFGHAVALYGDILVVGAPGDDGRNDGGAIMVDRGSVFVYRRVTRGGVSTWQFVQKILPPAGAGQNFGHDVDVGADGTIVVGALAPSNEDNGTVSIFRALPLSAQFADLAESQAMSPRVSPLVDGGFVVTWQESVDATRTNDIFAQRFDSIGDAVGFESLLSGTRKDSQQSPSAVPSANGFVVVWTGGGVSGDGALGGISGRRFGAAVIPLDAEFQVNSYTAGNQGEPRIAALESGRIGVTWAGSGAGDNSRGGGVFARAFDAETPTASQTRVNEFTAGRQSHPAVAPHGDGFIVVWQSDGEDGSEVGVYARAIDAEAKPTGSAFRVNQNTSLAQKAPAVAPTARGGFVVAWESAGQDGDGNGVFARRYGPRGSSLGGEFQVNVETLGDQSGASVTGTLTGSFVVVWTSSGQHGDGNDVYLRRFSSKGAGESEIRVNVDTAGDQQNASIATLAGGDLLVAWQSDLLGGTALMGRRFSETGDPLGQDFRIDNIFPTWKLEREFTEADVPAGTLGLGASVGIAGEEIVFGAPGDGSLVCGNAFASERVGGEWSVPQDLSAVWAEGPPDPDPFECIGFGSSVAIDENLALVGAPGSSGGPVRDFYNGRVYPFRRFVQSARVGTLDAGEAKPGPSGARFVKPGSPTDVYGPDSCKPGCYAKKVRTGRDGRIIVSCPCDGDKGLIQPDANRRLLCGNGTINTGTGEQCDDGNLEDGDCCSADCQFENAGSTCDDGSDCTTESCDGKGGCIATPVDEGCALRCGQPLSSGPRPIATDCLFILQASVGNETCEAACVCDINGSGGSPSATDALVCLDVAVGVEGLLNCSCPSTGLANLGPAAAAVRTAHGVAAAIVHRALAWLW